jgi:hypothetical protein
MHALFIDGEGILNQGKKKPPSISLNDGLLKN